MEISCLRNSCENGKVAIKSFIYSLLFSSLTMTGWHTQFRWKTTKVHCQVKDFYSFFLYFGEFSYTYLNMNFSFHKSLSLFCAMSLSSFFKYRIFACHIGLSASRLVVLVCIIFFFNVFTIIEVGSFVFILNVSSICSRYFYILCDILSTLNSNSLFQDLTQFLDGQKIGFKHETDVLYSVLNSMSILLTITYALTRILSTFILYISFLYLVLSWLSATSYPLCPPLCQASSAAIRSDKLVR